MEKKSSPTNNGMRQKPKHGRDGEQKRRFAVLCLEPQHLARGTSLTPFLFF